MRGQPFATTCAVTRAFALPLQDRIASVDMIGTFELCTQARTTKVSGVESGGRRSKSVSAPRYAQIVSRSLSDRQSFLFCQPELPLMGQLVPVAVPAKKV